MKTKIFLLLLVLSLSAQAQRFHNQKIVGFVQGDRNAAHVDYANLTHAVFAFISPNANGTLKAMAPGIKANFNLYLAATEKGGAKRIISIAPVGVSGSRIKDLAKNPVALHKFADTLVKFCKLYKMAGVDVDWELITNVSDGQNYATLMDTLNINLHKAGLVLSTDVAFTNYYGQWMPDAGLHKADWLNVMAYDGAGWGNGPFGNHSSMQHMLAGTYYWISRGFAKDKLVMGVPFYGHTFSNTASESVTPISYNNIAGLFPNLPDSANQSPGADYTFFNGPGLIRKKCQYLIDSSFGGVMIWDMTQDAIGEKSLHKQIVCTYNDENCKPVKQACQVNLNTGLVSNWSFTGNAKDTTHNSNHGTASGAILTTDRFGNADNAYAFDMANKSMIDCGTDASLNVDDFTISAWVNTSQYPSDFQTILAKYDYDSTASYVFYLNWNQPGIGIVDAARKNDVFFNGSTILAPDNWYYITASHSYANGTKLYINGMLDTHDTTHIHVNQAPADHFKIGSSTALKQFEGKLDDISIHNRELSSCEIDSMFHAFPLFSNGKAALPCTPDTDNGLMANLIFDGTTEDLSNSMHKGTNMGAQTAADRFGNPNSAYSFAPTSYIDYGTDTILDVNDFSFSAWIKTDSYSSSGFPVIFTKLRTNPDTAFAYSLYLYDSYPVVYLNGPSGASVFIQANSIITPDKWHHIMATHSYANGTKIYVNGLLEKHDTRQMHVLKVPNSHFKIGKTDAFDGDQFLGRIDDVRIYNTEISECAVEKLYRLPYADRITAVQDEQIAKPGINVYPNPSKGNFTITLPELPRPGTHVSISDITGRKVFDSKLTEIDTTIQISQPSGIYFVNVLTEKGSQVIKVIINN